MFLSLKQGMNHSERIGGDKIWVHEGNADLGIAEVITREGIPKSKIVLRFLAIY